MSVSVTIATLKTLNHTKIEFGMVPVVIWYEYHAASVFVVNSYITQ